MRNRDLLRIVGSERAARPPIRKEVSHASANNAPGADGRREHPRVDSSRLPPEVGGRQEGAVGGAAPSDEMWLR